jgi:hypothetical protein
MAITEIPIFEEALSLVQLSTHSPTGETKGYGCRSNLSQMKGDKCFRTSCGFITQLTQRSALNEFFKNSQKIGAISVIQSRTNFHSLS